MNVKRGIICTGCGSNCELFFVEIDDLEFILCGDCIEDIEESGDDDE